MQAVAVFQRSLGQDPTLVLGTHLNACGLLWPCGRFQNSATSYTLDSSQLKIKKLFLILSLRKLEACLAPYRVEHLNGTGLG